MMQETIEKEEFNKLINGDPFVKKTQKISSDLKVKIKKVKQ